MKGKRVWVAAAACALLLAGCSRPEDAEGYLAAGSGSESGAGQTSASPATTTAPAATTTAAPSTATESGTTTATTHRVTKATACAHSYIQKVITPTCTEKGYTLHTCSKCGDSYKDAYTGPHDFGKYLCEVCGLPDPDRGFYAMTAWVSKNLALDEDDYHAWVYRNGGEAYSLVYRDASYDTMTFRYENSGTGEFLSVQFYDKGSCIVNYNKDGMEGEAEMKMAALSNTLKLTDSRTKEGKACDASYNAAAGRRLDNMLRTVESQLLAPKLQFRLTTVGFAKY